MKPNNDDLVEGISKLMRIWDRLAEAIEEMHPDMTDEEREKVTREGMDLLLAGLTAPRVH